MPDISLFEADTGRFICSSNVPEQDIHLQNLRPTTNAAGKVVMAPDNSIIIVKGKYDGRTKYWRDNKIINRPKATTRTEFEIAADGVDKARFKVPSGTKVTDLRTLEQFIIDDGVFEFTSQFPGEYRYDIRPPFPHQKQYIRITAS